MARVTGPIRFQPPPYAGVADLLDHADLPLPASATQIDLPDQRDELPLELDHEAEESIQSRREPLGHRVARRFFTLCEHPRTRDRTMAMVRRSAGSAVGGRLLVAFLSRGVFRPLLRSRRIDHATARIELACAQLGGVAVLRYVTRMEPVASMTVDDLVAMVGPAVEASLSAPYREAGAAQP